MVITIGPEMRTERKETRTCGRCGTSYPNNRAGYYEHRLTAHGIQPPAATPKKTDYYRTKSWANSPERTARALEMKKLVESGWTLQQVGDEYALTRERVRQLLMSIGIMSVKDLRPSLKKLKPDPACRFCGKPYKVGTFHSIHVKTDEHKLRGAASERKRERNDQLVADYLSGMRLSDISMKHGVAFAIIYHALRRRGVPKRHDIPGHYDRSTASKHGQTKWTVSADIHEAVVETERSVPELSVLYGIPQGEIHRIRVAHRKLSCGCMKRPCDCSAGCTTPVIARRVRAGHTTCGACRKGFHRSPSHPNGSPASRRALAKRAG